MTLLTEGTYRLRNVMNISQLIKFLIAAICITICSLYLVITQPHRQEQQCQPYVVCTTTIIADAVKNIAGETIALQTLMGPGVDPHCYKPVENDLYKIAQADLVLYHGLHLEARMVDLFEHLSASQPVCCVTRDLDRKLLICAQECSNLYDPHIWFNPKLWMQVCNTVHECLATQFPEHALLYQKNYKKYVQEIARTYQTTYDHIQQIPCEKRYLITSHDAFSYFAQAYDFHVISLCGINTTSEAGITDVQNIIAAIIAHHIPTIFVESSIPARSMQAIAQGVLAQHHSVTIGPELYSDSLSTTDEPAHDYMGMLTYNITTIIDGLATYD